MVCLRRSPRYSMKRSLRHSLRHTLRHFSKAFSVPHFPFFHSPIRVLIITFYYIFTHVLFITHYNKYMTCEDKRIDIGEFFNANSFIWHVLNSRGFPPHVFWSKYWSTECFSYERTCSLETTRGFILFSSFTWVFKITKIIHCIMSGNN